MIRLRETETICLLSIPGSAVTDPGQHEAVQRSNEQYQEVRQLSCLKSHHKNTSFQLLKVRQGNDRYSERGMQTIDNARKTKHIQTDQILTTVSQTHEKWWSTV